MLNMLMTSPAESWQTIQGSKEIRDAKNKEQVLGKALDADTNDWDAELGIGPEEIVAACVLAAYIGTKEHAKHIADYAFMWARGWTAVSWISAYKRKVAESLVVVFERARSHVCRGDWVGHTFETPK